MGHQFTEYNLQNLFKIINDRIHNISDTILLGGQSCFWKGRFCIDDVFSLKQIINKQRGFNLETHLAFINYEKVFDKVKRAKL